MLPFTSNNSQVSALSTPSKEDNEEKAQLKTMFGSLLLGLQSTDCSSVTQWNFVLGLKL